MAEAARLAHFPISFFATVMGLAGLAIAWEKAQSSLGLGLPLALPLVGLTAAVFLAVLALYLAKLVRHPAAVVQELRHPVKLSFFPTISISIILLGTASLPLLPTLAHALWWIGTGLHLAFTLYVLNAWIQQEHFEVQHMNPAWFIPVVGNVLVPIAGLPLGYVELSWFFFSIGMLFWVVLFTIIFYRVLFHHPIPARLTPTLFILIAPPAVGFVSYTRLAGGLDSFGRVLFFSAVFLTLLLFTQIGRFARLQFFLSWWAYSFPLAAITIASFVMHDLSGVGAYRMLGIGLLGLLTLVVAMLCVRTLLAIRAQGICVPEG
ncbi:MAG: SLAC1 anion channel family protein [Chromatiales bacterium]|jgi:tellurite resistance protein